MEAIRKIKTVENGEIYLQLPKQFWDQEVEIIVLASPRQIALPAPQKKSLRGALKHYAKPDLIAQEQGAWQTAISEKHEHR